MFHDLDYFEFEERDVVDFGFTYNFGEEKKSQSNPIGFTWVKDSGIIIPQEKEKKK